MDLVLLAIAATTAGFIDAVAGGGGLIQVPALFTLLPGESPAVLFGTNKGSSIVGTANATWRYGRGLRLPWDIALPAAATAILFSYVGAATVAWLPREVVRPVVLGLLVGVFAHTAWRPDFGGGRGGGRNIAPRWRPWAAAGAGAALGFYDGFFGPGAGSFMIFAFVWLFGLDFLRASGAAKVVNLATNAAALLYFLPHGQVLWATTLVMAVFNFLGATVGTRLALRHGTDFVRLLFLVATAMLIGKFGYDTLRF
ncbi:MAG TPA: TSUP family transporter [Rhodocyclaceae bacterium]|nr:TSUP family transporter [Rhodocyclaceae bacterium]